MDSDEFFSSIANEINKALDTYFPADLFAQLNGASDQTKLKIIAEPGRYYACSAFTLCVSVIAKREMDQSEEQKKADKQMYTCTSESAVTAASITGYACSTKQPLTPTHIEKSLDPSKSMMYYINDGVFASFNCLIYDNAKCLPILMKNELDLTRLYKSSIWGPTCDGYDVVLKECLLPELDIEDYMIFKDMGAYTLSGAVPYNGIPLPRCIYVVSVTSWVTLKNAFEDTVLSESFI